MRLLHVDTLRLSDFDVEVPPYVILSHRWQGSEITFEDVQYSDGTWQDQETGRKAINTCVAARKRGFSWVWIDTCCIDKRSSAELSEAINSMFLWYRQASVCYAYLDDVTTFDDLESSIWFSRGWTLQELIAPDNVWFFNKDWSFISDRFSMIGELSRITNIDEVVLRHGHEPEPTNWEDHNFRDIGITEFKCRCGIKSYDSQTLRGVLDAFSIATRMTWASKRTTTREEDMAYCLMGIFDINMPLLYGEKGKAFIRLQEEIIRRNDDQSILAWVSVDSINGINWYETRDLAYGPRCFVPLDVKKQWLLDDPEYDSAMSPQMNITKRGLEVELLLYPIDGFGFTNESESYLAVLDCTMGENPLMRPAMVIGKPPWSRNVYDRTSSGLLMQFEPDSSRSIGYAKVAATPETTELGDFTEEKLYPWEEEIDLTTGFRRTVILARTSLHRSTHSLNRYNLPPLRLKQVDDCDQGHFDTEYAMPGLDNAWKMCPPTNEAYGLIMFTKAKEQRFFVIWTLDPENRNTNGGKKLCCKVLAPSVYLDERFASSKERGQIKRSHSLELEREIMTLGLMSLVGFEQAGMVDKVLIQFGQVSREVTAELTRQEFESRTSLELTVRIEEPTGSSDVVEAKQIQRTHTGLSSSWFETNGYR